VVIKMGEFDQIIIFGNNADGATRETWVKALEGLKKYGMESVYMGAPLGVSENRVLIIKGSMSEYSKMIGDPDWPIGKVMTNTRSVVCWTP
jgi:hypothetical protein